MACRILSIHAFYQALFCIHRSCRFPFLVISLHVRFMLLQMSGPVFYSIFSFRFYPFRFLLIIMAADNIGYIPPDLCALGTEVLPFIKLPSAIRTFPHCIFLRRSDLRLSFCLFFFSSAQQITGINANKIPKVINSAIISPLFIVLCLIPACNCPVFCTIPARLRLFMPFLTQIYPGLFLP